MDYSPIILFTHISLHMIRYSSYSPHLRQPMPTNLSHIWAERT